MKMRPLGSVYLSSSETFRSVMVASVSGGSGRRKKPKRIMVPHFRWHINHCLKRENKTSGADRDLARMAAAGKVLVRGARRVEVEHAIDMRTQRMQRNGPVHFLEHLARADVN